MSWTIQLFNSFVCSLAYDGAARKRAAACLPCHAWCLLSLIKAVERRVMACSQRWGKVDYRRMVVSQNNKEKTHGRLLEWISTWSLWVSRESGTGGKEHLRGSKHEQKNPFRKDRVSREEMGLQVSLTVILSYPSERSCLYFKRTWLILQ